MTRLQGLPPDGRAQASHRTGAIRRGTVPERTRQEAGADHRTCRSAIPAKTARRLPPAPGFRTMSASWFFALLLAGLSAWLIRMYVRLPPRTERVHPPRAPATAPAWQAVRIVPAAGACACAAARLQAGRLYPPGQAPITPLMQCDRHGHCTCHYETVHDRRHNERRSGFDRRTGLRYEPGRSDRRASRDRRQTYAWTGAIA